MSPNLEEKLCQKYPSLFTQRNKSIQESCMAFGCEHQDGWFDLLETTCSLIQHDIENNRMPPVEFAQIKEKFGQLRIYFDGGDERTEGITDMAEAMSYKICEMCGKPGRPNKIGWIITLCDECRAKREQSRNTMEE